MSSEIENRDWLNDYPSLKQVKETNPFNVPAGYFDDLNNRIVSNIYVSELKGSNAREGFAVPENYFDELADNIQSRIAIEAIINIEDKGFTIPDDYFNHLEQQIESRIFIEETLSEPVDHFVVPEDYFAGLSKNILDKTVNEKKPANKVIIRKLYHTTAFKYATAACVALAVGGGILIGQLTNPSYVHKHSFLHKELSVVPIDDIKSYLQLNVDAGDTQQTVVSQGVPVDDDGLKKALQNDIDSVQ